MSVNGTFILTHTDKPVSPSESKGQINKKESVIASEVASTERGNLHAYIKGYYS
jgi:hypothetical protein